MRQVLASDGIEGAPGPGVAVLPNGGEAARSPAPPAQVEMPFVPRARALLDYFRARLADLREENRFLRGQLEASRTAEQQLRVLLAQTMRALDAATAPPALEASLQPEAAPVADDRPPAPAPPEPPHRPWWAFWRRSGPALAGSRTPHAAPGTRPAPQMR